MHLIKALPQRFACCSVVTTLYGATHTIQKSSLSEGKTSRDTHGHCHVFLPSNNIQDPVTGEWSKMCSCGLKEPVEVL